MTQPSAGQAPVTVDYLGRRGGDLTGYGPCVEQGFDYNFLSGYVTDDSGSNKTCIMDTVTYVIAFLL